MIFTKKNLDLWGVYAVDYFIEILNGEYDLEDAKRDLTDLINESKKEK